MTSPQPLRYCLDSGFSYKVAEAARASALNVIHVSEVPELLDEVATAPGQCAASDERVAAWCVANSSILVVIDTDSTARGSRSAALRDAGVEVICVISGVVGVDPQLQAIVRYHSGWEVALGKVNRQPRVWVQRKQGRPALFKRRQTPSRGGLRRGLPATPSTPTATPIRRQKRRKRIVGDRPIYSYKFEWLPGSTVLSRPDVLDAASELYSAHYGRWGPGGLRPGEWIRMSATQLAAELRGEDTCMALAWRDGQLVGYCVAVRFALAEAGRVVWVSQLVVHSGHRDFGVGTTLLYSVWQFSDCYAWGLATANPRAVRALERATRRRVSADLVRDNAPGLLPALQTHVGYMPGALS